jgi:hypothetical protein
MEQNNSTQETKETKYRVVSIEKTDPPAGTDDGSWYHYVIGQGHSKIECTRLGSLQDVTKHAEEYAESLNARAGKGYSTYAATRKQKK